MKEKINKATVITYFLLFCGVVIGLQIVGCAYNRVGIQGVVLDKIKTEALKRSDYNVLQAANGTSSTKYIALWPLPIFWITGEEGISSTVIFGSPSVAREIAERNAILNAVESVPNSDAIICPRYVEENISYGIWYKKITITVKGKAISIKTDEGATK